MLAKLSQNIKSSRSNSSDKFKLLPKENNGELQSSHISIADQRKLSVMDI